MKRILLALLMLAAAHAWADEAMLALEDRVRRGDADAAIALARRLEFGLGLESDMARAADLYCEAALRGRAEAALRLAGMFLDGEGVPADVFVAARWLAMGQRAPRSIASQPAALLRQPCAAGPALAANVVMPYLGGAPVPTAEVSRLVREIAGRQLLDPALALAMVAVESAFRTDAVSPRGARGLLQLMPGTAATLGVADPHDPVQNLVGGIIHMRRLLGRYGGDVALALAAYNAGEGAVERHRGIPPYAETQAYVQRVLWLRGRVRD